MDGKSIIQKDRILIMAIQVTVWNEYRHEREDPAITSIYPDGIHMALAEMLRADPHIIVKTATLDEPEHGLSDDVINKTDVLVWWGHMAHHAVNDKIVEKVHNRILCGMGFIALHSSHMSKIFTKLMGTSCSLRWRDSGEKERLWVIEPSHPIMQGIGEYIELDCEEMYGERFDIPAPDALVMAGWFRGGELFRSACCFTRGCGKIFYFQPGHETFPTYHNQDIQKIIKNAVKWASPSASTSNLSGSHVPEPLERL
jgi:trehalose utilization protein